MANLCEPDAQRTVMQALQVSASFDPEKEIERRIAFLCQQLLQYRRRSLVLGISGGVDSLTAGLLAQAAVNRVRQQGEDATFIAMRLPYGIQRDEHEAQHCLEVIRPDRILTTDIKPATDAMLSELVTSGLRFDSPAQEDFLRGNIKARQRMIAQYAAAGATQGLVIGTDHAAEALMGFFTKFGDGACDLAPLTGLNKRRVRALAKAMGAPDALVFKVPTADLECLVPQKPDEHAFGVSYDQIDDFLEGKTIDRAACEIISAQYHATAHKRALPVEPPAA